jgi:NADP-dependent 3-hydroxy acid dehydrogenase YdfG
MVMNTNVFGVFLCLKHEIAAMLNRGRGATVNNSSVSGLIAFPGAAIYVGEQAPRVWPHENCCINQWVR